MLYVITGGAASGKSSYAENLAVSEHEKQGGKLYYIATMHAEDSESLERIEKHRNNRRGKGFETVECPFNISELTPEKGSVILIDCMSNLLANEMYLTENIKKISDILERITDPVYSLSEENCVIAVTNEVFSSGENYSDESMKYMEFLGYINRKLSERADGVYEIVCSIPVVIKGRLQC